MNRRYLWMVPLWALLVLIITGCSVLLPEPPRLANQPETGTDPTPTPLVFKAPTATPSGRENAENGSESPIASNPSITVWINETSAEHVVLLESMQTTLASEYALDLDYVLINNDQLPALVETAVLSGTLPDLILHPLEFSITWANTGVLDVEANSAVAETLGRDTFSPQPLSFVTLADGQISALPSTGWPQIILYRQDWFNALSLQPPTTFGSLAFASEQIYQSPDIAAQTGISETLVSGIVISTESDRIETHHSFEQLALANGCSLIAESGELMIQDPICLDTIAFYQTLVNSYSPADIQTPTTAINAFLGGRTGIIFTTPDTLEAIYGFDPNYLPQCPECAADPNFLVNQTGVITSIASGRPEFGPTSFARLNYLGITTAADTESAQKFAIFWFTEGYLDWLAVEPAHKVPLRTGDQTNPQSSRDAWLTLPSGPNQPPLVDLIGAETTEALIASVDASRRWGFEFGQGDAIGRLHTEQVVAIRLQEMLSGYYSGERALSEIFVELVDLIPGYAYDTEPQASEEQDN